MSLLVLARPKLPVAARRRIDALRQRHDPQHSLVPPHLTFVFPTRAAGAARLEEEVRAAAAAFAPVPFRLTAAMPLPGLSVDAWFVALVAEQGFGRLLRLHDRLYAGALAADARLDLPYVPHVTVARLPGPAAARALADTINAEPFVLAGRVERLELVASKGRGLEVLAEAALTGTA